MEKYNECLGGSLEIAEDLGDTDFKERQKKFRGVHGDKVGNQNI